MKIPSREGCEILGWVAKGMYIPSLERFLNGGEVPLNLAKWEDGCFGHGTVNWSRPGRQETLLLAHDLPKLCK